MHGLALLLWAACAAFEAGHAGPVRTQPNVTALLGDRASIVCSFPTLSHGETVVEVDWFFKETFESCKEQPLRSSKHHCVLNATLGRAELVILNLQQEDDDLYECKVQRLLSGDVTSSTTRLLVIDEPRRAAESDTEGTPAWVFAVAVVAVMTSLVALWVYWSCRSPAKEATKAPETRCPESPIKTLLKYA